jgi:hypothetical protein
MEQEGRSGLRSTMPMTERRDLRLFSSSGACYGMPHSRSDKAADGATLSCYRAYSLEMTLNRTN